MPATGSRSTCRWCPRPSSRCWPARDSAPCTRWCSPGSRPPRSRARIDDAEAKLVITTDGQYRRGKAVLAEGGRGRGHRRARGRLPVEHVLVVRRTGIDVPWTEGRDLWWDETVAQGVDRTHPRGVRLRASAVPALHLGHHRQAQGHHAHLRWLPDPGVVHPLQRLRRQARHRRVLVHRRHRLGHRAHLHRLRAAVQRRHPGGLRGHPGLARRAPALRGHRKVRRDNLLHRSHAGAHLHEVGRQIAAEHDLSSLRLLGSVGEPINPEAWRWYRAVFGGDKTPIVDTWWQTETGADHDLAAARRDRLQARLGDASAAGHLGQDRRRRRQRARARHRPRRTGQRLPGARQAVAGDAARHLGRPGAVQGDLLVAVRRAGLVLRRRRRPLRQRTARSGCSAASTT